MNRVLATLSARRPLVVGLILVMSLVAACTGNGRTTGTDASPSSTTARSSSSGLADVGAGVLVEARLKNGVTSRILQDAARPYPRYESLAAVYEVTTKTQPAGGARIALPTLRAFDPASEVPLVLVAHSPNGPWQPLTATLVPGRALVEATTPHFSLLTAILIPVGGIVAELAKIFDEATSGVLAEAKQPQCPAEDEARTDGWSIDSVGEDTLKWCFGRNDTSRLLTVVNNRRYPLSLTHPGGHELPRTTSAIDLANYARFASPNRTLLLPGDSVTYSLASATSVATEFDGSAQSLYALQTGLELAIDFLTKFGFDGSVNKYYTAAFDSTKCVTVLQDPSQAGRILRDCFGDPKILLDAFGPKGLFLAALMMGSAVGEYFHSSVNAVGDLLNGRDRYVVTVSHAKQSLNVQWLYESTIGVDAAGPSGQQRSYSDAGISTPNATSFWVGCEGTPAVTTFQPRGDARTLAGTLVLDPKSTPRGLVVEVKIVGNGMAPFVVKLTQGTHVPLRISLGAATTVSLSAQAIAGSCSDSSLGYGAVADGRFI